MKFRILFIAVPAFIFVSCGNQQKSDKHSHEQNENTAHPNKSEEEHGHFHEDGTFHADEHKTEAGDVHEHEESEITIGEDGHDHVDVKIQLTAYSDNFEVFAEADPFVTGNSSNVLAHFTNLPDFSALESGSVKIRLIVDGKETSQILQKPTRKGIYTFNIKPQTVGKGVIIFDIKTDQDEFQVIVPEVEVYADEHEAIHEADEAEFSSINTVVFTKEQTWKIDFATEEPEVLPFGQVIKTTALVKSSQVEEVIVSAKTNGILKLSTNNILEGKSVSAGQKLFSIAGSGLAENNSEVRFAQTQNDFEKAKTNYERIKELANDRIVSEKELLNAKTQFDNAKVAYDNLNENFNSEGQKVVSPINGFVKQIWVENGQYVETGQAIVSIAQNNTLILNADVQQKYAPILGAIKSANIRTIHDNKTYTLEQLNGKIISVGNSTNSDNYQIPVNLQIDNRGGFVSGSFVEVYLKTKTNSSAITIPNSALLEEQGNFFVFVQITPELFEKRQVKPGFCDGLKTEIVNGLAWNERVVSKGAVLVKLSQSTGTLDAHSGHVH